MCVGIFTMEHVEVTNFNLWEPILSYHEDPSDWTQVVSLGVTLPTDLAPWPTTNPLTTTLLRILNLFGSFLPLSLICIEIE